MSDPRYIIEQGREEDIERTRHHFAAVIAGLRTAEEYIRTIEREGSSYLNQLARLREASETLLSYWEPPPRGTREYDYWEPPDGKTTRRILDDFRKALEEL